MKCLLLGTTGCHLCEEAAGIINKCLQMVADFEIEYFDIAEHLEQQQVYATRIPVLLHEDSAKTLDWPFTETQVIHFFKSIKP